MIDASEAQIVGADGIVVPLRHTTLVPFPCQLWPDPAHKRAVLRRYFQVVTAFAAPNPTTVTINYADLGLALRCLQHKCDIASF
jgi:hypothetical protein